MYMNDYDIEFALRRFDSPSTPNRYLVALTISRLAEWTNSHSDGWAYWPKPLRAAERAMRLVGSSTNAANDAQERTDAEVTAALRPIKAFLTRQAVSHDAVLVS